MKKLEGWKRLGERGEGKEKREGGRSKETIERKARKRRKRKNWETEMKDQMKTNRRQILGEPYRKEEGYKRQKEY